MSAASQRAKVAAKLRDLHRQAKAVETAAAQWCDTMAQETDARLGSDPGDEGMDARLADPAYKEALRRFSDTIELAARINLIAERFEAVPAVLGTAHGDLPLNDIEQQHRDLED